MSRRPSPLKSATPHPRCMATAAARPAWRSHHGNGRPSLTNRLLACFHPTASTSPIRSLACELAVKMSFLPSLSMSATIAHHPDDLIVSAAETARLRRLDECAVAVVAEEREGFARQRGEMDVLPPVVVVVLEIRPHARNRPAGRRHGDTSEERRLGERAVAVVAEKEVGHGVVGDEHVETSVVIVVGKRRAHALADMRQQPGARRHVLERAVAAVAIQAVRQALKKSRVAVDPEAAGLIAAVTIRRRATIRRS